MKTSIKQTHPSLKCMFIPMHVLPCLPHYITAPMALMNGHVNACSWHRARNIRENPNLACANKQIIKETEVQKNRQEDKYRDILCERSKKTQIRVSGHEYVCAYIGHVEACARKHTKTLT